MIKLVENNKEASLVLEQLSVDMAPILAAKMFTEGFGVNQDFLKFYAAFSDNGKLCAAFISCNDRIFCLIEELYNTDEILLFLNGFQDYKIFISSEHSNIIERNDFYICNLMKKCGTFEYRLDKVKTIESKDFTDIIMKDKDRDSYIRFFLNNSHLQRHGYLQNYALFNKGSALCVASVFNDVNHTYLCNVFTPAEHRANGFATALINNVTDNTTECHLICQEDVSKLYEKCGFVTYSKWIEYLY